MKKYGPNQFQQIQISLAAHIDELLHEEILKAATSSLLGVELPPQCCTPELLDYVGDEMQRQEESTKRRLMFCVVGLYSDVEITRSRLLRLAGINKCDLFKIETVKKKLKELHVDEALLSESNTLNKIKAINNNFKHNGEKVGKRLAGEFSEFKLGDTIPLNFEIIHSFITSAGIYIRDLGRNLSSDIS